MNFLPNEIYHIYNRGNQKQMIFQRDDHYLYFLEKMQRFIVPHCDLLCWCLMPNHFHLLVSTNELSIASVKNAVIALQQLSNGVRLALSSYTQGYNREMNLTGNLFQQKTKSKCTSAVRSGTADNAKISNAFNFYSRVAFDYIHQNPYRGGLVQKMEDWRWSSFREYMQFKPEAKIAPIKCNVALAEQLLDLNMTNFYADSYRAVPDEISRNIY